jgi:hypothetical protein
VRLCYADSADPRCCPRNLSCDSPPPDVVNGYAPVTWTVAPQLTSRADNVMGAKQGTHPRHPGCGDTLKSGFQNGYQLKRVLDGACQSVHTLSRPKEP